MQASSEITYLSVLTRLYPTINTSDFISLVLCGNDLNNQFEGWCGTVATQIYGNGRYKEFFGDFQESLMDLENVSEFAINRFKTKQTAIDEFVSTILSITPNPIFVSSNVATWAIPILSKIIEASSIPMKYNVLDLRKVYGTCRFSRKLVTHEFVSHAFDDAQPVSKMHGVRQMADELGVKAYNNADSPSYRATLIAESFKTLMDMEHCPDEPNS